jgi:hypothetical protein
VKAVRGVLIVIATIGARGTIENWNSELQRNPWLGLFAVCAGWALIVHLFYIQPKGKR